MRVVDTSAWIEYFLGSPTGKALLPEMPVRDQTIVPTIVQFELAKWLARETPEDDATRVQADMVQCMIAVLDTATALFAAEIARAHKLASADAIIYATSQLHRADLLTCDAHFKDLPGVLYFPKAKP